MTLVLFQAALQMVRAKQKKIDIDILAYNSVEIDSSKLHIP